MKFRRLFRFKSIHTNIAIAFSCLILCTTGILSYNSYRLSSDAVTDNSLEYTKQLIDQVNTNIQTYISNMESISTLALSNEDRKRFLSLSGSEAAERGKITNQLSSFFHSIVQSRDDIASILYVGPNEAVVSDRTNAVLKTYTELTNQEWYSKAEAAHGSVVISSSHVQHIFHNEYRWVVSISRQLPGGQGEQSGGVLLVDLNYNVINDLCRQIQLGKKGYVFILDPTGDLLYHPQQQLIYSGLKSEEIATILHSPDSSITTDPSNERKIYTIRTTDFGWKIVGVTYPDELVGNKAEIQFSSALWGFLCLIIALAISVLLSFTLTKPIKKLDAHMKQVEKGDFDIRVEINSPNEIGKLSRSFNIMIGKIKELMDQIVEEQETKRISELKALQAQIKPHFLYNTLDSIIWMAEMGKMDEVVKMTSALSKLLRSSISKGEELVPIAVELEHVENYLTIQNIRYRNKFTYALDVEPEILNCKILKIVLQPLVENAIYHGLKHKADAGHIHITGERSGHDIILKVIDDGVGMDTEKAKSLLSKTHFKGKGMEMGVSVKASSGASANVGLQNVNHRIQLYFGEQYGLVFDSEPEEGTIVTLRIPVLF